MKYIFQVFDNCQQNDIKDAVLSEVWVRPQRSYGDLFVYDQVLQKLWNTVQGTAVLKLWQHNLGQDLPTEPSKKRKVEIVQVPVLETLKVEVDVLLPQNKRKVFWVEE